MDLTDRQRATLTALLADRPTLTEARTLALEFARLVRERDGTAFESWLVAVEASGIAALRPDGGPGGARPRLEFRPGRGADQPAEAGQA